MHQAVILGLLSARCPRDLNQGAIDLYNWGQELRWLSRVLPSLAEGDLAPFNAADTEARQALAEVIPLLDSLPDEFFSTAEFSQAFANYSAGLDQTWCCSRERPRAIWHRSRHTLASFLRLRHARAHALAGHAYLDPIAVADERDLARLFADNAGADGRVCIHSSC